MKTKETSAIIFGSHFNSYSILQELKSVGVKDIILLYTEKGLATYSNIPLRKIQVENNYSGYYNALTELRSTYTKLVLFPTNDDHVDFFYEFYERLIDFCYVPLNPKTYKNAIDKFNQYMACDRFKVPYPKTIRLNSVDAIKNILESDFPLIVKPVQREDSKNEIFRNIIFKDKESFYEQENKIFKALNDGFELIVSEIIPGHSNGTIYAYCAYRSPKDGTILNEWTGKKLSQHPNDYGVFSSASNEAPDVIRDQGRKLIEKLDLFGFIEPEFKYDERDGQYKLMEINLRPMMWNRMGYLSGVKLHYAQWLDANNKQVEPETQIKEKKLHFYYLRHELNNLRRRRGYSKVFKNSLYGGDKNYMALWNIQDIKPFLFDLLVTIKNHLIYKR